MCVWGLSCWGFIYITQALDGESESILVVDDEKDIRQLGLAILEHVGDQVLEASDGETALSIFQQDRAALDLIRLDLNMPGMGGFQCLQKIRTIDPVILVLIASGHAPDKREKAIPDDRAQGDVNKPYRLETMVHVVRQPLGLNRS